MICMFFLVICINEESPGNRREILRYEANGPWFLFQLLHVGYLFHVHLVSLLVIEMIFKIG